MNRIVAFLGEISPLRMVAVANQQINRRAIEQDAVSQVELVMRTHHEELIGQHPISSCEMEDEILNSMAFSKAVA